MKENATKAVTLYSTFPDKKLAEKAIKQLLEERLIACANLMPGATSYYRWEGEMQKERELLLFCKTNAQKAEEVTKRLAQIHPYDCPCIIIWPISTGHPEYLQWIHHETDLQSDST
jgi:periplasmic divalent cation tolerance protein